MTASAVRSGVSRLLERVSAALTIVTMVTGFSVPTLALADATGTLQTTGNGNYTSWSGNEGDIDETSSFDCGNGDSISKNTADDRESFTINLASVPDSAIITSVDITVRDQDHSDAGTGGTYKTFTRLNGIDTDAAANLAATTVGTCSSPKTQNIDVADTIKSSATTLEIGVIKTATDGDKVRVGTMSAVVNYTPVPTEIVSMTLVSSGGGVPDPDIETIDNGDVFNYDALGTTSLSIRADATPAGDFGSVVFNFDGAATVNDHTENDTLWTANGNSGSDYSSISPNLSVGEHTVTVTPYSGDNGTGTAGTSLTRTFIIAENENTLARCTDGIDNNGVNGIDLADLSCAAYIPNLTVIKTVINDGGGTKEAIDFTINIDATNPSNDDFAAAEAPGTTLTLDPGAYAVSETGPSGYAASYSPDCSGTIAAGQSKTCTITNNDQAGTLIVTKDLINDNGGLNTNDSFFFQIDGGTAIQFEADGSNAIALPVGTYDVTEVGSGGYTTSYDNCTDIVISDGGTATCTITNDDQPAHLTLVKNVTNNNGGTADATAWTLSASGPTPISGTSGEAAVTNAPVDQGVYDLSETGGPDGYTAASWSCVNNGGQPTVGNSISLSLNDNATCTITNNDQPATLTIVKTTSGGDSTFNFTVTKDGSTVVASPEVTTHDGTGSVTPIEMVALNLTAGHYTVSEAAKTNWDPNSASCQQENGPPADPPLVPDLAGTASFTADVGQSWICTFTNTKRGSITVSKDVVSPNGQTDVTDNHEFSVTLNDGNQQTISEASSYTYDHLVQGTYKIAEITGDPDFDLLRISGDNDDNAQNGAEITVAAGQNVAVTITNGQKWGHLTVIKHVTNHNIGNAVASDFTLNLTGTNADPSSFSGNEEGTEIVLDPGNYSVGESGPQGYAMSQTAGCSGAMPSNGQATCTVTNSDIPDGQGAITVIKSVTNDNGGETPAGTFGLFLTQGDGDPQSVTSGQANFLEPDTYTISEADPTSLGYTQSSIRCTNGNDETLDGSVELGEQDAWVCTITNDDIAPSLTLIKEVINDNGGSAVSTDWTLTATGLSTVSGNGTAVSDSEFQAGSYTLSEAAANSQSSITSGYIAGSWSCTNDVSVSENNHITLGIGQSTTCTITNDDQPGTLTIIKETDSQSGDGEFDFTIAGTGNTQFSDSLSLETEDNAAQSDAISLNAGTYDVLETIQDGWHLADVSCVYDGESVGQNIQQGESITVQPGNDITCTFTNTRRGTLIVKKVVTNDNGGTLTADDFSFMVGEGEPTVFNQNEEDPLRGENHLVVNGGTYSVTEPQNTTYTTTYDNCSEIEVPAGSEATCTITNDDIQPMLTVKKFVINDDGGTKVSSDFTLTVKNNGAVVATFAGSETGTVIGLSAGTYKAEEGDMLNYNDFPSATCTGTIALGQRIVCDITNNDGILNGGGGNTGGQVAGASTETPSPEQPAGEQPEGQVLGEQTGVCTVLYLNAPPYIANGRAPGLFGEIVKLQQFLNSHQGENLAVNGIYDRPTIAAVKRFQRKFATQILSPWGLTDPTGWTYLTTTWMINKLSSSDCEPLLGSLVPFSS